MLNREKGIEFGVNSSKINTAGGCPAASVGWVEHSDTLNQNQHRRATPGGFDFDVGSFA
jgi:hypothetical protein